MVLLLSLNEADCLERQHGRTQCNELLDDLRYGIPRERFGPLAEARQRRHADSL